MKRRCLRWAGTLVFACAVGLLAGCATPQVTQLQALSSQSKLPAAAQVADVPFFAQREYECGPAALAMAMASAGVQVSPDALVEQVYLPARKGSLQVEMQAATRRNGLVAYTLRSTLQAVLQELAAGHAVLVFQNLSLPVYPVWHYAVAIAYDLDRNTITLHSGETARMDMSLYAFERTWARGNYWAMLALPPQQLPASAEAMDVARAIAALEPQHTEAARTAYQTAVDRWPRHSSLLFGLGNTEYALGNKPAAAAAFAAAVQAQPDFADAWNNLAQTQWDLGLATQARVAIEKAVALGGARLAQYLEFQAQIGPATP